MIYDTLANAHLYEGISERLKKAFDFLRNSDFSSMADGRYEIDGDDVFANLSTKTTSSEPPAIEAHDKYIDVQYLAEGHEWIGVTQRDTLTLLEAHPEKDISFYKGNFEYLSIGDGRFVVLWPHDAHAPDHAPNGVPGKTRKCVVKVRV